MFVVSGVDVTNVCVHGFWCRCYQCVFLVSGVYVTNVCSWFLVLMLPMCSRFDQPDGHAGRPAPRDRAVWRLPHDRLAARHRTRPHATPTHHQEEKRRLLGAGQECPRRLVRVGVCTSRWSSYWYVDFHISYSC